MKLILALQSDVSTRWSSKYGMVSFDMEDIRNLENSNLVAMKRIHTPQQVHLKEPHNMDKDPLIWWKENQAVYPNIANLKKILGILPTQANVERIFSSAGLIVTTKRSNMTNDNIRNSVFLKKNLQKIP
eukprot:TRINITY_DN3789_c0_g1_i2.p1 TRINITY_DN3789_c0_g1~~TRINITY_DN3789_c0_g1_i2.p1  ORF type:complete len:129 (-),score=19.06 TRINITY_DN3789_c0_g1_i2:19-405(-)